jgi:hypothetical protein
VKPLFTVHAGEYLVGAHIEKHYRRWSVWMPSKDTGIDLLVTGHGNSRTVSLQVKFSKDFTPHATEAGANLLQNKLVSMGWFTHQPAKLKKSVADFWVFVLPSFTDRETNFVIIEPLDLLRRLAAIHGKRRARIHSYFWVTKTRRCWEARGLSSTDHGHIGLDTFSHKERDFTAFLNAWDPLEDRLGS